MKLNNIFVMIFLFSVLFIPFMVHAESCDPSKITISSVSVEEKSENIKELEQPVIEGKKIKVNLRMLEVGDAIEYKLSLKNDSNEDYELDQNTFTSDSPYIEYHVHTSDNSLVIKKGQTKEVYLRVQYQNEVPEASFTEGKFQDNKSFSLNLSNLKTGSNPPTGNRFLVMLIIVLLSFSILFYLYMENKKSLSLMILILGIITIPTSVYALCKVEIQVESNVIIEESYTVHYIIRETIKTSEKVNYDLFNPSNFGIDSPFPSCISIEGNNEYEVCSVIYKKEKHAPGDRVEVLDEFTYHALNGDGEYIEQTVSMDGTVQNSFYFFWEYIKSLNNYDDIDEMNFTGNIYNKWDDSYNPYLDVFFPNSFTMPSHDVFLVLINNLMVPVVPVEPVPFEPEPVDPWEPL